MSPLGIAVVTYQRQDRVARLLDRIQELTRASYELVVADDGSTDGTIETLRERGVRVVTGENRGVCWNKNRGLFALMSLGCDPLLLLEDDVLPEEEGWDAAWIEAAALWHHLAFAHDKISEEVLAGSGTPQDPYVNNKATAQCTAVSATALREVGFLDSRFRGYGVGHAEWTTRFKRAGLGFKEAVTPDGTTVKANLYIRGGIRAEDAKSFRDNMQVRANRELFARIKTEPIYRNPWTTPAERGAFLAEQAAAGIEPLPALLAVPMIESDIEIPEPAPAPAKAAAEPVKINSRKAKFDTGDVFAMEAMRPLAPQFIPWTSFSLRPSALLTVVNEVDYRRPGLVVECGGGASTLYLARLIQQREMEGTRLITVESDADWTAYLQGMLDRDGLGEMARVVHAPLVEWNAPDGVAPDDGSGIELPATWYDPAPIGEAIGDGRIGVLLVDGPPGGKVLSRYPAVPTLRGFLADDAAIMLDDAHRPAEAEATRRWALELGRTFTIYDRMHLAVGRLGRGFTLLGT